MGGRLDWRSCGGEMVPRTGVEPVHLSAAHFKCDVSTNFTIEAVTSGRRLDTERQKKSTA